jgi:Zn-dependent protease
MRNLFSTPDETIFAGSTNDNVELLKAWAGTTLAYAIVQAGPQNLFSLDFLFVLGIAAVVCGLGFVLHELAHRVVARRFNAQAHFVANNGFLLMSIIIAFVGFFIAAPGAVWYRGFLSPRQNGLIAIAGPLANLALALVFAALVPVLYYAGADIPGWLVLLCAVGFGLNSFIGLFNMIPAGPFDGAKVLEWSPLYFGITVAVGILMAFIIRDVDRIWRLLGLPV